MISYLAQTVNLLASLFHFFFNLTSFTGQIIVIVISSLTTVVYTTIVNIVLFFHIVYEDNVSIFTEDIPGIAAEIYDYIRHQCLFILDGIISMYMDIDYKYKALVNATIWITDFLLAVCGEILLLWKKTFIFIGESLWLVLTFLPVHLPYIIKIIFRNISDSIVNYVIDTYMSLLKFSNFVSDVPLESFIGILLAIVIVRSCIYFRVVLQSHAVNVYWMLIRKIRYLYHAFYNYFTDSEVRMIAHLSSGDQLQVTREDPNFVDADDFLNMTESLCVICQERQKCVLTLPCRHICLCTECCIRLYGYQRTCPICRTFIYHSVTVYL